VKWKHRFMPLALGLALMVGVSCTSSSMPLAGDDGVVPTENGGVVPPWDGGLPSDSSGAVPPDSSGAVPPDSSGAVPPDSSGAVPPDSSEGALLACGPRPYASTTKVIGRAGGVIMVGDHGLYIYKNALSEDVTITAEQVEGEVVSVRFSPDGLRFAVPAVLWLSYKSCPKGKHPKHIVYTDESLNVLESFEATDFNSSSHIATLIEHFSRYAVAY
jgi:hypothetical protein